MHAPSLRFVRGVVETERAPSVEIIDSERGIDDVHIVCTELLIFL